MEKFNRRRPGEAASILSKRLKLAKGQTAVEFAMVSVLFFMLLFLVMDYGWLMFAQMNVQQAVDEGGRYASTGQGGGTGNGTRVGAIIAYIQSQISVPGVNASNITICSTPSGGGASTCYTGSSSGNPTNSEAAGGPKATVTISLTSTLPLLASTLPLLGQNNTIGSFSPFPTGYTFTSSTTFKNEPFKPEDSD